MSIVPNWRHPEGEEIQFIKSDGTVYNLHSPPSRAVRSMAGWGKPPETRNEIVGPFQHGNTVVSYRLQPRTISLELLHKYCSRSELYSGRSELLDQMGLNNASPNAPIPGVLRWRYIENSLYKIRDLDVYLTRGLGFQPLEGWRHWSVQEGLEFIAPNPVIYEPVTRTTTLNSFTSTLTFPITFPFVLGASYSTASITYAGTWETFPTIVVTGPAAGVYIENQTTGKLLRLNYVVSPGETVTFTLTYNGRAITNNIGLSLLGYLSDDSNLGEFGLQHDPIVAGGINVINVYTSGIVAGTTSIVFNYYNRYYGI
jgi:hypothetical protein